MRIAGAVSLCALAWLLCQREGQEPLSETTLGNAISDELAVNGRLCIGPLLLPADLTDQGLALKSKIPNGRAAKLEALANVGLLKIEAVEIEERGLLGLGTGRKLPMHRFSVSSAGRRFLASHEARRDEPHRLAQFCWAKRRLTRVIDWEPVPAHTRDAVLVRFNYEVADVAPWARIPEIQAAFPQLAWDLETSGSDQAQMPLVRLGGVWSAPSD